MDRPIHYSQNPGFKMPTKKLPHTLLRDLSAFTESESTDREARAAEVVEAYGMSVKDVLEQLEKYRTK